MASRKEEIEVLQLIKVKTNITRKVGIRGITLNITTWRNELHTYYISYIDNRYIKLSMKIHTI